MQVYVCIVLLVATTASCFRCVVARDVDNFHAVVIGKCYRSAQLSPERLEYYIKKIGIKTVINLRGKKSNRKWWRDENCVAKKHNVEHIDISMRASNLPDRKSIKRLLYAYKVAIRPVLLHCASGVNRTGLAAAVWILDQQKGTKEQALKQLSDKYGYRESLFPAKRKFIVLWKSRDWALHEYDPVRY